MAITTNYSAYATEFGEGEFTHQFSNRSAVLANNTDLQTFRKNKCDLKTVSK